MTRHNNIIIVRMFKSNVRVQVSPSPSNPMRHSQLYPPYEFLHLAYLEQLCSPLTHSSISKIQKMEINAKLHTIINTIAMRLQLLRLNIPKVQGVCAQFGLVSTCSVAQDLRQSRDLN